MFIIVCNLVLVGAMIWWYFVQNSVIVVVLQCQRLCYIMQLTLLHSERPKLYSILAFLSVTGFSCMGTCPCYFAILTKEDNFRTSLGNKTFLKGAYSWRNCSASCKHVSLRVDPNWEGRQNENARVASSESVLIHLINSWNNHKI